MRISKLKEIIKILEESKIDEIEIKGIFTKVRVCKKSSTPISNENNPGTHTIEVNKTEEEITFIKSPMVGTFYRAPAPGASPYVELGDRVTPEKIVCIIEAMKVFNEIPAGVSGIVDEILVKNEEHVEYGQPLFKISPQ